MTKKLLIIGLVWPEPKSSAAGRRMMQLISLFKYDGYTITFACSSKKNEKSINLDAIGISEKEIVLNNSSFDDFVKSLNPDIVLFDRFMIEEQFGWRVAENCPNALRILDTEDLHFLRRGRQKAFKDDKTFNQSHLFNETTKREIASIYRCDLSLIISEAEMKILTKNFKINEQLLFYIPFVFDEISKTDQEKLPQFENREHFIFVGNMRHEPNYNAVINLKKNIWPYIKQHIPKSELHIYGAYTSQKVKQFNNDKEGFFIKGFTEDIALKTRRARVCLAPLRYGAGLKGKLVDAMLNGTPVVTTTIGSEGLYGSFKPNGFIQDESSKFAQKAIELYNQKSTWIECKDNGFKIINKRFQKNLFKQRFFDTIKALLKDLNQHRANNFIGSMLMHHAMQSTKYLSLWIEQKNRNNLKQ